MKKLPTMLAGLVVATTAMSIASSASGVDGKMYPGTWCVARDSDDQSDLVYTWDGAVYNTAAASRVIDCPAVKDNVGGTTMNTVKIFYWSNTTAGSCRTETHDNNSTSANYGSLTSFGSGGYGTLSWSGTLSSGNEWLHKLKCTLPSTASGTTYVKVYRVDDP